MGRSTCCASCTGKRGSCWSSRNRRLIVYKIPRQKSLLRRTAGFAFGFVPLGPIGDVMDAGGEVIDKARSVGRGLKTAKDWVSSGERRNKKQNVADGMPNRKDRLDVVWDLREPDIVAMVTCYRDRILMENAFDWKVRRETCWQDPECSLLAIRVGHDEVTFALGEAEPTGYPFHYLDADYGLLEIANFLIETNIDSLESHGWGAAIDGDELIVGLLEDAVEAS